MLDDFTAAIITASFFDPVNGVVVKDKVDLNKNINSYKNQLGEKLRQQFPNLEPIFEDDVFNYHNYRLLMLSAYNKFKDYTKESLDTIYVHNPLLLDAFNAYAQLLFFDELLGQATSFSNPSKHARGEHITIDKRYAGQHTNVELLKYDINKDSNIRKNWTTEDGSDASKDIGSVTKMFIEATPLKTVDGKPIKGKFLQLSDIFTVFGKIKNRNRGNFTAKYQANPINAIKNTLANLIESSEFRSYYNHNERQVITTFYNAFFRNDPKNTEPGYSLLESINRDEVVHQDSLWLLETIAAAVTRSAPFTYVQTSFNDRSGISVSSPTISLIQSSSYLLQNQISQHGYGGGRISPSLLGENLENITMSIGDGGIMTIKVKIPTKSTNYQITYTQQPGSNGNGESQTSLYIIDRKGNPSTLSTEIKNDAMNEIITYMDNVLGTDLTDVNSNLYRSLLDAIPKKVGQIIVPNSQVLAIFAPLLARAHYALLKNSGNKFTEAADGNHFAEDDYGRIKGINTKNLSPITFLNEAKISESGDWSRNNTKDLEGNSIPLHGSTNAFNTFAQVLYDPSLKAYEDPSEGSRIPYKNLLIENPHVVLKEVILNGAISPDGTIKKSHKKMNSHEIFYLAFNAYFVNALREDITDGNNFIIQPAVYSDKTLIHALELNKKAVIYENNTLQHATNQDLFNYYIQDISSHYNKLKFNLLNDYYMILSSIKGYKVPKRENLTLNHIKKAFNDGILTKESIDNAIREINEISEGIDNIEEVFYTKYRDGVSYNHTLFHEIELFTNASETKTYLDVQFEIFLNEITDEALQLVYSSTGTSTKFTPLGYYFDNPKNRVNRNSLFVSMETGETIDPDSFVDNDRQVMRKYNADGEANPLLYKWFLMQNLVSFDFQSLMFSRAWNHPFKGKKEGLTPAKELATRIAVKDKRGSSAVSTYSNFMQNSINGVPANMTVAVMATHKAPVFNSIGEGKNNEVFDGASFTLMPFAILENLSLQDSSVGLDKKTFGTSMDYKYHTQSIIKHAEYVLSNERRRFANKAVEHHIPEGAIDLVENHHIDLTNLVKKALGRPVSYNGQPVDITYSAFKEQEIPLPTNFHYNPQTRKYMSVTGLVYEGNGNYTVTMEESDQSGTLLSGTAESSNYTINSVYDIIKLFGDEYSMSLNADKQLEFSEESNYIAVHYINSIGFVRDGATFNKNDISTYTQTNVYQPFKESMIHMIPTIDSIKSGAANVNPVSSFFDDKPLQTYQIKTTNIGVQLNKEHESDMSETTESTQMIAALVEMGRSHDDAHEVYNAIRKLIFNVIEDVYDSVNEFEDIKDIQYTKAKELIYNKLADIVLKTIGSRRTRFNDSTASIVSNINKKLQQELKLDSKTLPSKLQTKIPFSDPGLLTSVVTNVASFFNRNAIRRSYPGLGGVLTPAYGFMQYYEIDGKKYTAEDLRKKQERGETINWDAAPEINVFDIEIGKVYYYEYTDEQGKKQAFVEKIDNLEKFYKLENLAQKYRDEFILKPSLTHKVDLLAERIVFTTNNIDYLKRPQKANVYQTTAYRALHVVNESVKNGQPIPSNLYLYLGEDVNNAFNQLLDNPKAALEFAQDRMQDLYDDIKAGKRIHLGTNASLTTIESYEVKPSEMIIPFIYKSIFGISKSDSLQDVLEYNNNGNNYFTQKLLNRKGVDPNAKFMIAVLRNDGKHIYLASGHPPKDALPVPMNSFRKGTIKYRSDAEGNIMYRLPEHAQVYSKDGVEYIYLGNDGVISDDYREEIIDMILDLNPHDNDIVFADESVYNTYNEELLYEPNLSFDEFSDNSKSIKKMQEQGERIMASFKTSLDYIATRIPTQAMQSFMPMKAVAFAESDNNSVYVSHHQFWVQGSDLDIDASYIMGRTFSKDGRLLGWSPYFNYKHLEQSQNLPMPDGKRRTFVD